MGSGGYFLIHPISRGRTYWAFVTTADRPDLCYAREKAEVAGRLAAWHQPIPGLIAATPDEAVIHIDIRDLDPLPTYVRGRVALLGDAAHAMSPTAVRAPDRPSRMRSCWPPPCTPRPASTPRWPATTPSAGPRTQATARGARADGRRTTSAAAHRVLAAMIRLMPAPVWRRGIAADGKATWRWRPPRLPEPTTHA
ncbi:hypothetical protein AB0M50_46410 [Nonomuraea fuscirosea]|uniref:hypothetical protein n=1 Tax=Nonomuraea fuscirosea TaxID=1291556 RepID=UPI00343C063E